MGSRAQCGEDTERFVLPAASGGEKNVAQLADRGLEQHRRQLGVLGDAVAGLDRGCRPVVDELDARDGEYAAGNHTRGDRLRDRLRVVVGNIDVDHVRFVVPGGHDVVDRADEQPVVTHVGPVGQPVTDVGQLGDDAGVGIKPPGGLIQQQADDGGRRGDHGHSAEQQRAIGRPAPAEIEDLCHQPPNLAPESRLNIAIVSSMLTTTTTLIADRIA